MSIGTIILVIVVVIVATAALVLRQRYYEGMIRREREWESKSSDDAKSFGEEPPRGDVRRHADGLFPQPTTPPSPPPAAQPPAQAAPAPKPTSGKAVPGGPTTEVANDADLIPSPSVSIALGALSGLTGAPPVVAPPSENVQFTAYYPKEAAVAQWYTLLVYAHVVSALTKVQADAAKFKDEMGGLQRETKSAPPARLARGTDIEIVPECDGVTFNPPRVGLKWIENIHRADFRFQASSDQAGSAANLRVSIFVGPLLIATIKGGILFDDSAPQPDAGGDTSSATATMYKAEQIFPSYSHNDEKIVLACRNAYRAIGFDYLRDRDLLRPGEKWNEALLKYIDRADIFQLFWSQSSAMSPNVRQEWEYALKISAQKDAGFIRPVYWEQPMPVPPPELEPLNFTFVPLTGDKGH